MAGEKVRAEYQDEYALEDFEIKLATYMSPWHLEPEDFSKQWEMILGEESNNTFQLKYSSTEAAQQELVRHLGMRVIEVPENIAAASAKNMVSVSLAGKYLGRHEILVVLLLAYDTKMGCLLKIKAKCSNSEISEEVVLSIE